MNLEQVMMELESLGTEQTRKIYRNHGITGELFGVKISDLKVLRKEVKKDQALALALFETKNYDAMYLAGLAVNPKEMTQAKLEHWMALTGSKLVAEYIIPPVAAMSPHALPLIKKWLASDDEIMKSCGYATLSHYISITPDEALDLKWLSDVLDDIAKNIHSQQNRVRHCMNGLVIAIGTYVEPLNAKAMDVAEVIGKVSVNMGATSCKVPLATAYIEKVTTAGRVGKKRKSCRC